MSELKSVLMRRDGLTASEADEVIQEAKDSLLERLEAGEMPFDIMEEKFDLEPDYLFDLM